MSKFILSPSIQSNSSELFSKTFNCSILADWKSHRASNRMNAVADRWHLFRTHWDSMRWCKIDKLFFHKAEQFFWFTQAKAATGTNGIPSWSSASRNEWWPNYEYRRLQGVIFYLVSPPPPYSDYSCIVCTSKS